MNHQQLTKLDYLIIVIVAICIGAFATLVISYTKIKPEPTDNCWYEIRYIHMSGREITKRAYCTCSGFHHWYQSDKYKIEMTVPFVDGESIKIQGATDIISVAKVKRQ